ncbi:hypothetical protein K3495_g13713 [Podosphaera aphanis]|nr:hypothetical protein K3495_g13713 [Podosphaera aphanis]
MESQTKQFCCRCCYERPISDFQINEQGKRMKACFKHGKKRALPEPEKHQWDEFIFEINEWSQPLPVSFDFLSETDVTHIEEYEPLNQAVSKLTELIREAGGHRFRKRFITKKTNIVYYYRCSQDTEFKPKTKLSVKRDRHQMERIACGSNLKLSVNLLDRRFNVTLSHIYHEKYTDIQITPSILAFLSTRSSTKTPIELYRELQLSGISDFDKFAQHQVSYQ